MLEFMLYFIEPWGYVERKASVKLCFSWHLSLTFNLDIQWKGRRIFHYTPQDDVFIFIVNY